VINSLSDNHSYLQNLILCSGNVLYRVVPEVSGSDLPRHLRGGVDDQGVRVQTVFLQRRMERVRSVDTICTL